MMELVYHIYHFCIESLTDNQKILVLCKFRCLSKAIKNWFYNYDAHQYQVTITETQQMDLYYKISQNCKFTIERRYTNLILTDNIKYPSNIVGISCSKTIIPNTIHKFVNLTSLFIGSNVSIQDTDILKFPKLEKLHIGNNNAVTNKGLDYVPHLVELSLGNNKQITDKGLVNLRKLQYLDLGSNNNVTISGLLSISNLKFVNIKFSKKITTHHKLILKKRGISIIDF